MRVPRHTYGLWLVVVASSAAAQPALQRSDVVFMYQANRATYEEYGATVLAWASPSRCRG